MARLVVTPASALVDGALGVRVVDGRPGARITVCARVDDPVRGLWRSQAMFEADASGAVDLASARPLAGSYLTADPLGLVWSLERDPSRPPAAGFAGPSDAFAVDFEIADDVRRADGDTRRSPEAGAEPDATAAAHASMRARRCFVGADVVRRPVRDDGLVGTFFGAADGRPRPGVLVVGGSDGGLSEGAAALLASHGFAVLALAYFRAAHLPPDLVEIPLEYFETAIGWLRGRPEVAAGGVGVVGRSRGGELALVLGATFREVRAVVGYVPSGVVHAGIAASPMAGAAPPSAWTFRGRPLTFVAPPAETLVSRPTAPSSVPEEAPLELTPMFLKALEDRAAVAAAAIPVERIGGPVLLLSGEDDRLWPSPTLAEIAVARLAAHHHPYPVTHLRYPGAGHMFGPIGLPATANTIVHPLRGRAMALGGTAAANAAAAADSWPRVLAFLHSSLPLP